MQNEDLKAAEAINMMPTPAEQATADTNTYTLAQVAEHATAENCWLAIDGKVLNVSAFVGNHPGGDVIVQGCGKDATEMFTKVRQHSKTSVQAMKEKFIIGTLAQ
jgi:cytochrome b involved in lipid metabolism